MHSSEGGEDVSPSRPLSTTQSGNRVMIMPDHDAVVVISKTDYGKRGMHDAAQALFDDFVVNKLQNTKQ